MFRTRIELKQIGVRDEAKRLDGIGRCGRQYCSASWLPELRPVNLGVAKDQRLSLNPSQISGACGRLMCCLRYEHEFYVHSRKRFPKEGKILKTARGEEKLIANDIFRERVTLRGEDGEVRTITLVELHTEAETAGTPLAVAMIAATVAVSDESDDVGIEDLAHEEERADAVAHAHVMSQASEPRPDSAAESDDDADADDLTSEIATASGEAMAGGENRDRKPHRRRGRRGGRRNRPGNRGPRDGSPDAPPEGGSPAGDA
jgi:hypothetical protein